LEISSDISKKQKARRSIGDKEHTKPFCIKSRRKKFGNENISCRHGGAGEKHI
jgi:hypothetical protein